MTTLHEAAQQALAAWNTGDLRVLGPAMGALRAALKQEEEAAAWLAERKEHWRKEREKAQEAKDQDPELSAALGWPGGISNPVLDRTQLLQMVAALRVSAQQALPSYGSLKVLGQTYVLCPKHGKHAYTINSAIPGYEGAWCQICWLESLGAPLPTERGEA